MDGKDFQKDERGRTEGKKSRKDWVETKLKERCGRLRKRG